MMGWIWYRSTNEDRLAKHTPLIKYLQYVPFSLEFNAMWISYFIGSKENQMSVK